MRLVSSNINAKEAHSYEGALFLSKKEKKAYICLQVAISRILRQSKKKKKKKTTSKYKKRNQEREREREKKGI